MSTVIGVETQEQDNLITGFKPCLTDNALQVEAGNFKRGTVLKKGTTGLVALAATSDTPYCVILIDTDATSAATSTSYTTDASVLGSELIFGTGTLANFRDAFKTSTNLYIEE